MTIITLILSLLLHGNSVTPPAPQPYPDPQVATIDSGDDETVQCPVVPAGQPQPDCFAIPPFQPPVSGPVTGNATKRRSKK